MGRFWMAIIFFKMIITSIYGLDYEEMNIEYKGVELKKIDFIYTWDECSHRCRAMLYCVGWSYNFIQLECHLKEEITSRVINNNMISGDRYCGEGNQCRPVRGILEGTAIKLDGVKGSDCIKACQDARTTNPDIDGVTHHMDLNKDDSCFCYMNSMGVLTNDDMRSCFLPDESCKFKTDKKAVYVRSAEYKKIYNKTAADCIKTCKGLRKLDSTINGVLTYSAPEPFEFCWCMGEMKNIIENTKYKVCFLERVFQPKSDCNYIIGQQVDGKYEKINVPALQCADVCAKRKNVAVAISRGYEDGKCWCYTELKEILTTTRKYSFCFLRDHPLYSKPKRLSASKSSASAGFGYLPCDVMRSATTVSFQSCFKLCLDYTSCKSFSYSSTTKDCFVSSQDKKSCKDFVIDKTFMYFEIY